MRKVIGITIAVFMLAGSLVGCGNSDTEKSKTATVTSIETQAETEETVETTTRADSKDGWGSTTSSRYREFYKAAVWNVLDRTGRFGIWFKRTECKVFRKSGSTDHGSHSAFLCRWGNIV